RDLPGGCEGAPARLEQIIIRGATSQGRATLHGHKWTGGRQISRHIALDQRFVTVVPRGEVDADALDHALHDRVLDGLNEPRRQQFGIKTVRIADDLGKTTIDDVIERRVEILEIVWRADEDDVGSWRHAMHGLNVQ